MKICPQQIKSTVTYVFWIIFYAQQLLKETAAHADITKQHETHIYTHSYAMLTVPYQVALCL